MFVLPVLVVFIYKVVPTAHSSVLRHRNAMYAYHPRGYRATDTVIYIRHRLPPSLHVTAHFPWLNFVAKYSLEKPLRQKWKLSSYFSAQWNIFRSSICRNDVLLKQILKWERSFIRIKPSILRVPIVSNFMKFNHAVTGKVLGGIYTLYCRAKAKRSMKIWMLPNFPDKIFVFREIMNIFHLNFQIHNIDLHRKYSGKLEEKFRQVSLNILILRREIW